MRIIFENKTYLETKPLNEFDKESRKTFTTLLSKVSEMRNFRIPVLLDNGEERFVFIAGHNIQHTELTLEEMESLKDVLLEEESKPEV